MELTGPQPAEPAVVKGPPESGSTSSIVNNIIGRNPGSLPESATAGITNDEPAAPEIVLIAKKLSVPVEDASPVVSTTTDTSPRVAPFMKRAMDPVADLLEKPSKALADSIEGPVRKLSSIIRQPAESANSILNNYMKPLKDAIAKGRNGDSKDVSLGDLFSDWFSTTFPGAKLPSNPLETVDFIAGTMSSDFEADPTGDTPPTVLDIVPKDQAFEVLVYGALDTAMKQGVKFQDKDTAKQWLYDFLEKEEDFLIKTGLANEETGEYPNEKTIDLIANILKIGYGS